MTHVVIFVVCIALTGCGPQWKRKFIRKRNGHKPEQIFVYEPKDYQRDPSDVLYQRDFQFWKAWQEELIVKLGDNKTADLRSFDEVLKNLDEMKGCLKDEKSMELENYIKEIKVLYDKYKSEDFSIVQSKQMRDDLNRLMLKMDKKFRYNRVKDYIR